MVAAEAPPSHWRIGDILQWTQRYFSEQELPTPRLDAEVLLAHVLQKDRVYLYTHYDQPLNQDESSRFGAAVRRRRAHEPVAYITGMRDFFGRTFAVSPAALIPRPESEHVVEAALAWLKQHALLTPRILDVGTGSGALAITLALELPQASITACDNSADALQQAHQNVVRHGVEKRLELCESDLLQHVGPEGFDLIVANLPYIPAGTQLPISVANFEPSAALFGGPTGLQCIERLCPQAHAALRTPGALILEMGWDQKAAVLQSLRTAGTWQRLDTHKDLQGHDRVVLAQRSVSP